MSWTDANAGCNGYGRSAVGSWANDPLRRVLAEQEQGRQRALLEDQIRMGGIRVSYWNGVDVSTTRCACYKASSQASDRKCASCHGTSYVPGFLKFGYDTVWMSATDTDVVLTNTEISTEFKSAKITLSETATTGTVESGDKPFSRSAVGSVWEYDSQSFIREDSYSSCTIEYSLNAGSTWSVIANIVTENPVTGSIRFRATLTRDSVDILSPFFEIVRARYSTINLSDDGRRGPWILLMRPSPKLNKVKSEWGDKPTSDVMPVWTAGLSMFDSSLTVGSQEELIKGPGAMFEILDGALVGYRYVMTNWQYSDPFGYIIVTQNLNIRIVDTVDPYSLIW
jgi:hypothetical protein